MRARCPLSREAEIIDAAESVFEGERAEALTMRRLATELNIRAPSLYKHVGARTTSFSRSRCAHLEGRRLRFPDVTTFLPSPSPTVPGRSPTHASTNSSAGTPWIGLVCPKVLKKTPQPHHSWKPPSTTLSARVRSGPLAHGLVDLGLAGRFPADVDLDGVWAAGIGVFPTPNDNNTRHRQDRAMSPIADGGGRLHLRLERSCGWYPHVRTDASRAVCPVTMSSRAPSVPAAKWLPPPT